MIKNPQINAHEFLVDMYSDDYFPNHLVDKVKQVLLNLCEKIESKQPENLEKLYVLTHEAIEKKMIYKKSLMKPIVRLKQWLEKALPRTLILLLKFMGLLMLMWKS